MREPKLGKTRQVLMDDIPPDDSPHLSERTPSELEKPIPFNNLYLLSGLVHGLNKGWMYLFTVMFVLFGYFGYQLMIAVPLIEILQTRGYSAAEMEENPTLLFDAAALGLDRNIVLLLEMGMFVFALMALYTGVRRLHNKPFVSILTGFEQFRFSRFWFAFSIWGSMILVAVVLSYLAAPGEVTVAFNPVGFLFSALILLVFMPLQTLSEEAFFRGYLLQGLSLVFRNGIIPLLVTTALFATAHMGNPEVRKHGAAIMLTYYCSTALFFGAVTLIDEGIELAYGLHFANNIVSALLVTSPNSVIKPYAIFETPTEEPGAEILIWSVMAVIAFFIFRWRYRWKNFRLLIR
jgi:uncharacterized protein